MECEAFDEADTEPGVPEHELITICALEEIRVVREAALLHATACDELRRDLERAKRREAALRRRIELQDAVIDELRRR